MKKVLLSAALPCLIGIGILAATSTRAAAPAPRQNTTAATRLIPAPHSEEVPPDTHLTLEFDYPVQVNRQGMIRIFDAETDGCRLTSTPHPAALTHPT